MIVFQPNGTVSGAEFVDGSFNGTDVGGCILQRFRGARIPRFTGSAVPVHMDFVL